MRRILFFSIAAIILAVGGYFLYDFFFAKKDSVTTATETKAEEIEVNIDEEIPFLSDVPVNHQFEFDFSHPLAAETVTNESVTVVDEEKDEEVAINVHLQNDNKTIVIDPPQGNYEKETYYVIQFAESITYEDGASLENESYVLRFLTERDEVEEATLNPELMYIDNNHITQFTESEAVIHQDAAEEINKADILILHTDEAPDGHAIKVVKVEKKDDHFVITHEEPKFEELFEELDIYKTYPINEENMILPEGVNTVSLETAERISTDKELASLLFSSKKDDEKYEFETKINPRTKEKVMKLKLKEFEVEHDGDTYYISGELNLINPNILIDADIKWFKVKRLHAVAQFKQELNAKIRQDITAKKKDNDKKKKKKKPKDIKVMIPTSIPGLVVEGKVRFIVKQNVKGEVTLQAVIDFDFKRGVDYTPKRTNYINDVHHDIRADLIGKGTIHAKSGVGLYAGLTAFKIVGIGVEAIGGLQAKGEVTSGNSPKANGSFTCMKANAGPFVEGHLKAQALLDYVQLVDWTFASKSWNMLDINNCTKLVDISANKTAVTLKPGESTEIQLKGTYVDLLSLKESERRLPEGDWGVERVDTNVIKVTPNKGKSTVTIEAKNVNGTKDTSFRIKGDSASLDINVTLKGKTEKKQKETKQKDSESNNELKRIVKDTYNKLHDYTRSLTERDDLTWLYEEFPSYYNEDGTATPSNRYKEVEKIASEYFKDYVTKDFLSDVVFDFLDEYFAAFHMYMPYYSMYVDTGFEVLENSRDYFKVKYIELEMEGPVSGSATHYVEFKKENGRWKLSGHHSTSPSEEPFNLTAEKLGCATSEGEVTSETPCLFIEEVERNGESYIVYEDLEFGGIVARNVKDSMFNYDLMEEYR